MLVRLSDIPEAELAGYELPPAHKKRRRASVGWGSCFRLEALPPTPGSLPCPQAPTVSVSNRKTDTTEGARAVVDTVYAFVNVFCAE